MKSATFTYHIFGSDNMCAGHRLSWARPDAFMPLADVPRQAGQKADAVGLRGTGKRCCSTR